MIACNEENAATKCTKLTSRLNVVGVMNVEWNRLSGTLPVELFQLQLLERLQLGMNYLNGSLAAVESLSLPFLGTFGNARDRPCVCRTH